MELTPNLILEAVRRLGFSADSAREIATGYTNTVYRAGSLAVRVSREPEYEELHALEAVLVPRARAAGVATPELLAVDDSRSVIPAVFSVYPWIEGEVLGIQDGPTSKWSDAARIIGQEAARLHSLKAQPDVEPAWWPDPHEAIDTLVEKELPVSLEASALHDWADRLGRAAPDFVPILTHNDLHPWNVLVHNGEFAAILDWANGGLGDPALDFAGLPLDLLPPMLEGYRRLCRTPPFMEAGILLRWLGRALEEMTDLQSVETYPRRWRRWPEGGLAEAWLILQSAGPDWSIWSPE